MLRANISHFAIEISVEKYIGQPIPIRLIDNEYILDEDNQKLILHKKDGQYEKKYKGIFFDWDGTAVLSRSEPARELIDVMIMLLKQDVKLIIVSGTTYDNIVSGKLHEYIPNECLRNLYMCLGRGAYNFGFNEAGEMITLTDILPTIDKKLLIDKVSFALHENLYKEFGYETDIVFSRANYCKVDLLTHNDRGDKLFLQRGEIDIVLDALSQHGYKEGFLGLMEMAVALGKAHNIPIKATTDGKYLEIGLTTKSDNVDYMLDHVLNKVDIENYAFLGDEFAYITEGIKGSDAYMITEKSLKGDFYDVSMDKGQLPNEVQYLGRGIEGFFEFLKGQINR